MPKDNDKLKEIVGGTFKRVVSDLIVGILFYAFMPIHWIFVVMFILFIGGNIYTIIYSAIELNDFKPLIYFLMTNWVGGSDGEQ
ncbi:MAG: hypothetical protein WDZ77_02160 [Candidatus Pacearchaeota archaeon]